MLGDAEEPGIMVLAAREIFDELKSRHDRSFVIR